LWARRKLLAGDDPSWVFTGLRMSDRTRLFQFLQLDVAGSGAADHATRVLEACGLPARRSRTETHVVHEWNEIAELADAGEDDRAATWARQRAERLLRKILYFYCSTGFASVFVDLVANPGNLRIPKPFSSTGPSDVAAQFLNDDAADLGFLALALRKFSVRLERSGACGQNGSPLILLSASEHDTLSRLATSLQPYTHDKPSKLLVRRSDLVAAAQSMSACVTAMVKRNVVPGEVLVVETCSSIVGDLFRGFTNDGKEVHLVAQTLPPLGQRVLFLSSAECQYATCVWALNPW
jgi:hypothetical protein